jgi:general L-amino acid transport system substrate-binding protein
MVGAEELEVTSENVDEMLTSENPVVLAMLGVEGELGKPMGLNNDWCYQVIKQVGNYGEVFSRNLGPDSPLKLERGLNDLWNRGGLLYAPPMR